MYGYGGVDIGCVAVVDVRGLGRGGHRVLIVALLVRGGLQDSDTQSFSKYVFPLGVVATGRVPWWMRTKGFA